jgi:hypothetical protein
MPKRPDAGLIALGLILVVLLGNVSWGIYSALFREISQAVPVPLSQATPDLPISDAGVVPTEWGYFIGNPIQFQRAVSEPRNIQLTREFGFRTAGKLWLVPRDAVVDGASIPQWAWSFIGGPQEGTYFDASVIHDFFCDTKGEPWREVHRVFYRAMRASGVEEFQARVMWAAVRYFGPRWRSQSADGRCIGDCLEPLPVRTAYNVRWFTAYVDWLAHDDWGTTFDDLEDLAALCEAPDPMVVMSRLRERNDVWTRELLVDFIKLGCPTREGTEAMKRAFSIHSDLF